MAKNQIVKWSEQLDSYRKYVTDSPSPATFASLLKGVDSGDLHDLCLMQQEMEAKSAHFKGVCNTRRAALTGLEWTIEPDEQAKNQAAARESADYCQEVLLGLRGFGCALNWLSKAVGPNVAVVETIWRDAAPVDFICVPFDRLRTNPYEGQGVNVLTPTELVYGVPTGSIPDKFIVFHPDENGWFPFRTTLTHASVWPYLVVNFSSKDWMAFSELYGNPIRVAKYDDAVVDADRDTVMDMLENMGSDVAGTFSKGVDVELLTVDGKGEAFERAITWAESKLSILWLGQTLTTDIGSVGSRAAAQVHDNVRFDLLVSLVKAEATCLRDQLLSPMVRFKFPGRDMPVPKFVRQLNRTRDVESERLNLEQLRLARELGVPIEQDEVYEKLGLRKPSGGSKPLVIPKPEPETPDGGNEDSEENQEPEA